MRSDEGINWAINSFIKPNKKGANRKPRSRDTRENKKLRYCEYCNKTWEIGFGSVIHSYDHLPTYGLLRKKCKICKNKKGY